MKKILTLIIPAVILMVACNNKPATETTTTTTDSVVVKDTTTTAVVDTTHGDGNPGVAASVFEDVTLTNLPDATIIATENGKTVDQATSDADGQFVMSKLVATHTYSFTATKKGYNALTKTAKYGGVSTIPYFPLAKTQ